LPRGNLNGRIGWKAVIRSSRLNDADAPILLKKSDFAGDSNFKGSPHYMLFRPGAAVSDLRRH
jgi:hypothetical protein